MLEALTIDNVVLIQHLDLVFKPGLTVLTGETGAGKSILLDALHLALGERADSNLIRQGTTEASVTACFKSSQNTQDLLQTLGIPHENQQVILRRQILKEGSSRAFINDKPVTLGTLRTLAVSLLDIHGQFDRLLDPLSHRQLLDTYGRHEEILNTLKILHTEWQDAKDLLLQARSTSQEKIQRLAFVSMALDELRKLAYTAQEEITLLQQRQTASHYSKIQEQGTLVYERLFGPRGVETQLGDALSSLEKIHGLSPNLFPVLHETVREALVAFQEQSQDLRSFCQSPQEYNLEAIDQRLYELRLSARKFGVDIPDLETLICDLESEYERLTIGEGGLEVLEKSVLQTKAAYETVAQNLSERRRSAALALETRVKQELDALKLEKASIHFSFDLLPESQWYGDGMERIVLMVKTNPGSAPGPLGKVASGGERSRLMLALKTVMNTTTEDFSQIFDEIDAGMGGAAASTVGMALKKLSLHQQILAISHAPQVAVFADHHWRVQKYEDQGQTLTRVDVLNPEDRLEEIARLLSGDEITQEARLAATALLAKAS